MKRAWLPITLSALALCLILLLVLSRQHARDPIVAIDVAPDSAAIAVARKSGRVQVLSVQSGGFKVEWTIPDCAGKWVNAVLLLRADELLCSGERLRHLTRTGNKEFAVPESGGAYGSVARVGDDLAVITASEHVVLLDGNTGALKGILDEHTALYGDLSVSADGKWLAASGHSIHVWTAGASGLSAKRELTHSYYTFGPIAFGPDRLYVGSQDGCIYIWTIPSWSEMPRLCVNAGTVSHLALSNDGKILAVAANNVFLFQTQDAARIATVGPGAVSGVSFLPDDSVLTAGGRAVQRWRCSGHDCKPEGRYDIP